MGFWTNWLETPEQRAERLAEHADWLRGAHAPERLAAERARERANSWWRIWDWE